MADLTPLDGFPSIDDERPLPIVVAEKWNFDLAYIIKNGNYLYSIQDWIKGLTELQDVRTIWADIKRRSSSPELLDSIQQLPYNATNKRKYMMDFTTDKGLYLISQQLRVTNKRPVLKAIKKYLAEAGVFVDEARRNPEAAADTFDELAAYKREYQKLIAEGFTPEEAEQWLNVRRKQKRGRLRITAIWSERGIKKPKDFADLTNHVHRVALGRTATRHKRELAIKDTPRNYISAADNATIQITEVTSGLLHEHRESFGKPELTEDIDDVRPIIDAARPEIQKVFSQKPRRLSAGNRPKPELDK
jgi:hypothetical protein